MLDLDVPYGKKRPLSSRPPRESRQSGTHRRPSDSELDHVSEVRRKASSLRDQGWRWEMQGRAFAYREAAAQVRRWLLDVGVPDRGRVEFIIELLENSAEVYDSIDDHEIVKD